MTRTYLPLLNVTLHIRTLSAVLIIGGSLIAVPAVADEATAKLAISRAEARVEMITRQAGVAGDAGDQSFNQARQRLVNARVALGSNHFDSAERLALQAALLASLSSERATLAALQASNTNLLAASNVAPSH